MGLFDWVFGKKAAAPPPMNQAEDGAAATALQAGDRVLASWVDAFFYPGRVQQIDGHSCEVVFDDGDVAWVNEANVRRPDIRSGSEVFCRFHAGPTYKPGTVAEQNGEKLQVQYENGEKEWTTLSMVRVKRRLADVPGPPAQVHQGQGQVNSPMTSMPGGQGGPMTAVTTAAGPMMPPPAGGFIPDVGDPVTDSNWRAGDRVLGRWYDFFWYPATILGIGTKGYHLLFDDGDQRIANDLGLMTLDCEEGEEVFIRPRNQSQRVYVPGRVLRAQGEVIDVELEDGTQETNLKVSRARFWRCPVGIHAVAFDEGDRALVQDIDGFFYPAEILSVDQDKVIVHFLDGPERMVTPELLKPFNLRVGTVVDCRWKGGQNYFRGQITELDGDRTHIAYEDGDKEWTTLRLVRIPGGEGQSTSR